MVHFYLSENHSKNDKISSIHQRVIIVEIKIDKNASEALDQDRTDGVSCISSSRAT